jgi:hypothetical protein
VLAINPTCSMMLRREWPELLGGADRERAKKAGRRHHGPERVPVVDPQRGALSTDFKSSPGGPVAYHAPCHLRAQGVGFKGRDLLRKLPGVKPQLVMECCGHDGTYAMTTHGFEPSQRIGKRAFDGHEGRRGRVWATDCPLAAIQFEQHAGRKPLHPMSHPGQGLPPFGQDHADAAAGAEGDVAARGADRCVVGEAEAVTREDRGEDLLHLVDREGGADAAADAAAEGRKLPRGELAGEPAFGAKGVGFGVEGWGGGG